MIHDEYSWYLISELVARCENIIQPLRYESSASTVLVFSAKFNEPITHDFHFTKHLPTLKRNSLQFLTRTAFFTPHPLHPHLVAAILIMNMTTFLHTNQSYIFSYFSMKYFSSIL